MKRIVAFSCLAAGAAIAACSSSDSSSAPNGSAQLLDASAAYTTVPSGFSNTTSSFAASATDGPFWPLFDGRGLKALFQSGHGPGFGIGFMGGLGDAFMGLGLAPFIRDDDCTYSSSTGIITCQKELQNGLTIGRTFKYTDAAGNAQPKIDTLTNTVATTISVTGTVTRRDSAQSTVNESSSQTVSGLARGSTQRTISGTSAGSETTTGTSSKGAFTANRAAGDTITGVVIPVGTAALSHPPYPSAGTVIRSMTVTMTLVGQAPAATSRREVITYDGSATAKVVITQDGVVQNCTLPLPFGHLSCQ
jgi:hypothetical protein